MEFRKYAGRNQISFIGLGCWRFGEPEDSDPVDNPGKSYWGGQKRKDSLKTLDAALRGGITHFDTAQSYGLGKSEQLTGQRLKKVREKCVISTKIMIDPGNVDKLEKKIDLSLKRLNTDYIDIMYIHWPSDEETIRKAVNILENAKYRGKIKYIGISNFSVKQMETAVKEGKIDFHQTGYNLLWRMSEKEIIPFCIKNDISVIAYSFLAQGLLKSANLENIGKKSNDRRRNLIFFKKNNDIVLNTVLSKLNKISMETGISLPQLIIGWGKSKSWLDSVLIGAGNRKQLEEILKSEEVNLKTEIIDQLEKLGHELNYTDISSGNIFNHTARLQD